MHVQRTRPATEPGRSRINPPEVADLWLPDNTLFPRLARGLFVSQKVRSIDLRNLDQVLGRVAVLGAHTLVRFGADRGLATGVT